MEKQGPSVDYLSLSLTCGGIAVTALSTWYFGRRILFHSRIRANLVDPPQTRDEGEYTLVEGKVRLIKGADPLTAPNSKERCVYYRAQTVHVYEKIIKKTSSGYFGVGKLFSFFRKRDGVGGSAMKLERVDASRNVLTEVVSEQVRSSNWIVEPAMTSRTTSGARLEKGEQTKVSFEVDLKKLMESNLLKVLKVADIEQFIRLEKVHDEFKAGKYSKGSNQVFNTLGYKTIETVLREGDSLLVLGEIGAFKYVKGSKIAALTEGKPKNLVDLKTARVRPLIVSRLTRSELKHFLERLMLWEICKCSAMALLGVASSSHGLYKLLC